MKFFETSAKDNINIETAFLSVAQDIKNFLVLNEPQPKRECSVILEDSNEKLSKIQGACCYLRY